MERAPGIELGRVWDQISSKQKDDVVRELMDIGEAYDETLFQGIWEYLSR